MDAATKNAGDMIDHLNLYYKPCASGRYRPGNYRELWPVPMRSLKEESPLKGVCYARKTSEGRTGHGTCTGHRFRDGELPALLNAS